MTGRLRFPAACVFLALLFVQTAQGQEGAEVPEAHAVTPAPTPDSAADSPSERPATPFVSRFAVKPGETATTDWRLRPETNEERLAVLNQRIEELAESRPSIVPPLLVLIAGGKTAVIALTTMVDVGSMMCHGYRCNEDGDDDSSSVAWIVAGGGTAVAIAGAVWLRSVINKRSPINRVIKPLQRERRQRASFAGTITPGRVSGSATWRF